MNRRSVTSLLLAVVVGAGALLLPRAEAVAQIPFREYPSFEGDDAAAPIPPDWNIPAEFVVGRLMYPGGRFGFGGSDWTHGGTSWTDDYPKGDRIFIGMLRRFTRTNVRGVEQPINPDNVGDPFYFPFMVVGLAQAWQLTDSQAATIREYLLRGGFLFCDSFFGERNWTTFEESLKRVFPDRPIIDMSDDHPIFHVVFDLPEMTKVQIPNAGAVRWGGGFGMRGTPRWRGVEDEHGRLVILIAYNNDVMDGWQWADEPRYPGNLANLALRLGVNVAMYSMTH